MAGNGPTTVGGPSNFLQDVTVQTKIIFGGGGTINSSQYTGQAATAIYSQSAGGIGSGGGSGPGGSYTVSDLNGYAATQATTQAANSTAVSVANAVSYSAAAYANAVAAANLSFSVPPVIGGSTPNTATFTTMHTTTNTAAFGTAFNVLANGSIGVGITDPTYGGSVGGVFSIAARSGAQSALVISANATQLSFALNPATNGSWTLYDRAANGGIGVWTAGITQSNGSVGIGTTTPTAALSINTTGGASPGSVWSSQWLAVGNTAYTNGAALGIGYNFSTGGQIASVSPNLSWNPLSYAAQVHNFYAASVSTSVPALYIAANANIGIGTTTAPQLLSLSSGAPELNFYSTTSTRTATIGFNDSYNLYINGPSGGYLLFNTSGSTSIGIGTTTPNYTLDVNGIIRTNNLIIASAATVTSSPTVNGQGLWLGWNSSGGGGESNFINQLGSGSVGGFNWQTSTTGNSRTTLMTLLNSGFLGIGTSSPSQVLTLQSTSYPYLALNTTSSANRRVGITMQQSSTGQYEFGVDLAGNNTQNFYIYDIVAGTSRFYIAPSTGAIGIGTSSPVGATNYGSMSINGSSGSFFSLMQNGSEGFRLQSDGFGNVINGISNQLLAFYTNNVERMRITAAGSVGVNTASPQRALHVSAGAAAGMLVDSIGYCGQYDMVYGSGSTWYNAGWRNDGGSVYLLGSAVQTTQAGAFTASYNSYRPITFNLSSGGLSLDGTGSGVYFGGNAIFTGGNGLLVNGLSAAFTTPGSGGNAWYLKSNNSGSVGINMLSSGGTSCGWVYGDTGPNMYFLNSTGNATFRVDNSGNAIVYGGLATAYNFTVGNSQSRSGETDIFFQTGGITNFYLYNNASGGNGQTIGLAYCNSSGTYVGSAFTVDRSYGQVTFNSGVTMNNYCNFGYAYPAIFNNGANGPQMYFGYNGLNGNYTHKISTVHNGGSQTNNQINFYVWNYGTDATSGITGTKQVLSLDYTGINFYTSNNILANGKEMFIVNDGYLRINQSSTFSSGVWFGNSNILSGGGYFAVGSNGGTTASKVGISGTYNGTQNITLDGDNGKIYVSGSLGIGTAASGTTGEIRATNNITAYYSDTRLKTVLGCIPFALDKVNALSGVIFRANDTAAIYGYTDTKEQVGVIAQEVEAILPQIVVPAPFDIGQNEDGSEYSISGENYKTVQYEKLVPLLIEAIKELSLKNNDLEKRLYILEEQDKGYI